MSTLQIMSQQKMNYAKTNNMKFKEFKNLLNKYKKIEKSYSELHDIGMDFYEGKYQLSSLTSEILTISLESHYMDKGVDWIMWFIFETDYGKKDMKGRDGDVPICYDMKSTWEYCEQHKHKTKTNQNILRYPYQ